MSVMMSLFKSTGEPLLTDNFDKWTLLHGPSDLIKHCLFNLLPQVHCQRVTYIVKTLPFKQPQVHGASA